MKIHIKELKKVLIRKNKLSFNNQTVGVPKPIKPIIPKKIIFYIKTR